MLSFPSRESMAEFILACRIARVDADIVYFTLTGEFPQECIDIALTEYGAVISDAPDFILPDERGRS